MTSAAERRGLEMLMGALLTSAKIPKLTKIPHYKLSNVNNTVS